MIFYMKINSFLQVGSIIFTGHSTQKSQSTQNSKFVMSLQYLRKEGRGEVDFSHIDKHQTILQVDTINLGGHGEACPDHPK